MRVFLFLCLMASHSVFGSSFLESSKRFSVSDDQFDCNMRVFHNCQKDQYGNNLTEVITPEDDMAKVEEILDVKFNYPMAIKSKRKDCPNCGRINNFLDVITTAIRGVHSISFLQKVFRGEFGNRVISHAPIQKCICYNCNISLPSDIVKYSAPVLPEGSESRLPIPVYSYTYNIPN